MSMKQGLDLSIIHLKLSVIRTQCITSSRGSTATIIAAGNALDNSIPPYYVFPGLRWNVYFLKDACPGSDGEMSKTGWSNTDVFHNYITKYVNLSKEKSAAPTVILFGHFYRLIWESFPIQNWPLFPNLGSAVAQW